MISIDTEVWVMMNWALWLILIRAEKDSNAPASIAKID
jgi:hypothetical protein